MLQLWLSVSTLAAALAGTPPVPGGCKLGAPAQTAIVQDSRFVAGESTAPVVLTLYACARSQYCSKLIPALYYDVVHGSLKGKVKLYFRPFYPETQKDAALCGRALVAAASQGMLWPYLLQLYYQQGNFEECKLHTWAKLQGLDRGAFDLAWDAPETLELLAVARREAVANQVEAIPTAFVNNRKVLCEPTREVLIELLEAEHRGQQAP